MLGLWWLFLPIWLWILLIWFLFQDAGSCCG
jgi:hypothetical protein